MRATSPKQEAVAADVGIVHDDHAPEAKSAQAASFVDRLPRVLRSEPWWLRGVSWGLVGMVGAITLMEIAPSFLGWLGSQSDNPDVCWAGAFLDLATHATAALAVLFVSTALVNLRHPRLPVSLALAIGVLIGSLLWVGLVYLTFAGIDPKPFWRQFNVILAEGRRMAMVWGIAAAAWYFLNRSAARQASLRAVEIARSQLETGMLEARLQALQAQVEPHFLFNTLAHIKRLYRTDRVRARLMLDSFRAYLRSALPQMRSAGATLGREIDLVHAYLDVQQVRMGQRLEVQIDVPEALRKETFPPMILISLVENAIKHGLNPLPSGGAVRVSASRRGEVLEVSVIDTGRGMADQIGSGVGLSNIRARLAALFGPQGDLSLTQNIPRGVCATIRIPRSAPAAQDVERGSIGTVEAEVAA